MRADNRFLSQPPHFWANVRSISQRAGYTARGTGNVKVHRLAEMVKAMTALGLASQHLADRGEPTQLAIDLESYFEYRADVLNTFVRTRLMNDSQAKAVFEELRSRLTPKCPLPMNKQKGLKRTSAYLSCIVNMLVEESVNDIPVDYDPRRLTTVTANGAPLRTLSRRVDGAFPSTVNPIAVWEIKEYYYTTSFGSRIADGVYETQLDGIELEELERVESFPIDHLLVVDAYETWWEDGRSYLCRIIDMLHMGLVDEVLFGREVLERLPKVVNEWVTKYREREATRA